MPFRFTLRTVKQTVRNINKKFWITFINMKGGKKEQDLRDVAWSNWTGHVIRVSGYAHTY